MALKLYQPHRTARTPVVTVGSYGQFRFSAEAARKAGLESAHWVRIFTDESERLIGFEFLDDPIQPERHQQAGARQEGQALLLVQGEGAN